MRTKYQDVDGKIEALRERFCKRPELLTEFQQRLDFSWIYHDNALEGVVLSYHEIKASIDKNIISDVSLIPTYTEIKNYKNAIDFIRDTINRRRPGGNFGHDFMKDIFLILSEEEVQPRNSKAARNSANAQPGQYRKDNPLHRLYFHEISSPDKIAYRVRKLVEWLSSEEAVRTHPIKRAAKAHMRFISIYPWPRHSGKIARLLMNSILLKDGYLPAIIHSIERQRYYEVLRTPHLGLTTLISESIDSTIEAANRFLDEMEDRPPLRVAS